MTDRARTAQSKKEWQAITMPLGLRYSGAVLSALADLNLSTLRTQDEDHVGDAIDKALREGGLTYRSRARDVGNLVASVMNQVSTVTNDVADDMVDALLIYYGVKPFIVEAKVPRHTKLPSSILQSTQYGHLITLKGEFVFLKEIEKSYVYVFSFHSPERCSSIGELHNLLPPISESEAITTSRICEEKSCSGAAGCYLYGNPKAACVDYSNPSYVVTYDENAMSDEHRQEEEKKVDLVGHLRSYFNDHYGDVAISAIDPSLYSKKKDKNFSMFSGGGDILISRKDKNLDKNFVLMTHTYSEVDSASPIDQFEESIECKDLSTMSFSDVLSQLQANMYNLLAHSTVERIKQCETLKSMKKQSIYGMSLPVTKPIVILKLCVNFDMHTLHFTQIYKSKYMAKEPVIDCCIEYVVKELATKSLSPSLP